MQLNFAKSTRQNLRILLLGASAAVAAVACQKNATVAAPGESLGAHTPVSQTGLAPAAKAPVRRAQVSVAPLGSNKIAGTLMFSELPDDAGVKIEGALAGLTPGKHGIHVHENPDCSAADGTSAGGHYNPTEAPHGDVEEARSHLGDLGNIVADKYGRAEVSIIKKGAHLGDAPSSFLRHSVIVHAGADDLHSQPAGDSGGRVACGIIAPL